MDACIIDFYGVLITQEFWVLWIAIDRQDQGQKISCDRIHEVVVEILHWCNTELLSGFDLWDHYGLDIFDWFTGDLNE